MSTGVLIIGAKGAIGTTLIAAQATARKKLGYTFHLPSEAEEAFKGVKLEGLEDMVFGGWDIASSSYSQAAQQHGVVNEYLIEKIAAELDATPEYPAITVDHDDTHQAILDSEGKVGRDRKIEFSSKVFAARDLRDMVRSLTLDIEAFKTTTKVKRVVVVNLASTERKVAIGAVHQSLAAFEKGLDANDKTISTGMLYAYAAIATGCSFVNFTPSICSDIPALEEFAKKKKVALAGKDGKTGQTLYKTALAPLFKARNLRIKGWYSANILGNRDGLVLNDPAHKELKIDSKSKVLEAILGYGDFDHQVHIHYYKPRGDSKEAWDNIDFEGWFNQKMELKINWQGEDSILAAPLVIDLVRWVEYFNQNGQAGTLPQLAGYFKSPINCPENDFFKQQQILVDAVKEVAKR